MLIPQQLVDVVHVPQPYLNIQPIHPQQPNQSTTASAFHI